MICRFRGVYSCFSTLVLAGMCLVSTLHAAPKGAPQVLPENTLFMLRVASVPELIEKFQQTALGRIGQDEKVKPLVSQLYASASEAFGEIQERVGMPLNELLAIPQGEICVAAVGPETGPPAVVVLLDASDRLGSVKKLIEKAEALMADGGGVRTTEVAGEVQFVIHEFGGDRGRRVIHFLKDGVFALFTNLDVAKQVLDSWNGGEGKTLADNKRFGAIMSRCGGGKDERPQVTWFVDPLETAKVATRGNTTAQAVMALIPIIGLDGLQSVGGSVAFAQGEFDSVVHVHVLLDDPRAGVIEVLALGEGDATPEPWIPGDISGYTTFFWDVEKSYRSAAKVYNGFAGQGTVENMLKTRISDQIGIDLEKEVFPELDGRFTYATRIQKPARINSETTLLAARLKDTKKFSEVFERVIDKYKENVEKKSFGGVTYYQIKVPARGGFGQPEGEGPALRRDEPCVALFDDYLVGTNSVGFLEQAIITKSDSSKSLAKELDFKLIASKIAKQAGGAKPGLVNFSRPEEGMRLLYDLAVSDDTKNLLSRQADGNRFFKTINTALTDNPLPPFAVISKYLAPGGGMITSDETGFHYTGFTLKRK